MFAVRPRLIHIENQVTFVRRFDRRSLAQAVALAFCQP
jgi:hypothetical protein